MFNHSLSKYMYKSKIIKFSSKLFIIMKVYVNTKWVNYLNSEI